MRPALQLERKLWAAWCARLGRQANSSYESSARRALSRCGRAMSLPDVIRSLTKCRVAVFGDDRLVPEDQEQILDLARHFGAGFKVCLITDRRRLSELSASPLLKYARGRRWRVLPCGEETSFQRMDREILRVAKRHRSNGEKLLVWTGALRLAPPNLPRLFGRQHLDASFFSLEAAQARWCSDRPRGWVSGHPGMFAFVGRSPLLSLEYFRAWSARSSELLRPENVESEFRESLRRICDRTGQPVPPKPKKVFSPFGLEVFESLAGSFGKSQAGRFLRERLRRGESAVVPRERIVLLSTLDPTDAAEEAAHYARLWNAPEQRFGTYRVVLEEALAFMASTWIRPDRAVAKGKPEDVSAWASAHGLGYRLGLRLAQRWNTSRKDRALLRTIWNRIPTSEPDARVLLGVLRTMA